MSSEDQPEATVNSTTVKPDGEIPLPPPKLERRQHGGNHTFMPVANQPERNAWAAERWSRDGWTYKQIGEAMGISTMSAGRNVQAGLRVSQEIAQATAEQARALHRARLEAATQVAEEIMYRQHVTVSQGRIVFGEGGVPVPDDAPNLAAAGKVRELSESLRKLDGLDAPAKVEMSGGLSYEVVGVDPADLT